MHVHLAVLTFACPNVYSHGSHWYFCTFHSFQKPLEFIVHFVLCLFCDLLEIHPIQASNQIHSQNRFIDCPYYVTENEQSGGCQIINLKQIT